MSKFIDADKLKQALISYANKAYGSSERFNFGIVGVLTTVDAQPEVKEPFKAVTEIKIDKDQLKEITKKAIDEMKSQMLATLPDNSTVDFGGWIPVKERLPEEFAPLLITTTWGEVDIATFYGCSDGFGIADDDCLVMAEVVAWRPLPEPYRECK